jgi:hypothetical protein|tara:strand:- start:33 stop:938 length:906 start_codon:yes stop_codon:yes gene_type:complete
MSLEDKIHKKLSEMEKYGEIAFPSSDIRKRVLDPKNEVKDFDDAIELGMYNAYELNEYDDFKFLEQFKNIEIKLEENPKFTAMAQSIAGLRKDVLESTGLASMLEVNKSLRDNPTYKSILAGQNKLREQLFKVSQPTQEFQDAIIRVALITNKHQQYHIKEQERLDEEHEKLQLEVKKSEMDMHSAQLELTTLLVKKADAVYVSDFYKKHEKNIQQHIKRKDTKKKVEGGVSKKQQAMLDDIYKMWIKYSSMKKGSYFADDLFDKRKRRYSNAECYNFIQAKYPKLKTSVIAEYIRKYPKK